jgi:hypothetical protein
VSSFSKPDPLLSLGLMNKKKKRVSITVDDIGNSFPAPITNIQPDIAENEEGVSYDDNTSNQFNIPPVSDNNTNPPPNSNHEETPFPSLNTESAVPQVEIDLNQDGKIENVTVQINDFPANVSENGSATDSQTNSARGSATSSMSSLGYSSRFP